MRASREGRGVTSLSHSRRIFLLAAGPRPAPASAPPRRGIFLLAAGTGLVLASTRHGGVSAAGTTTEEARLDITRIGSQPSARGPGDWFTGTVRIDPLFPAKAPARAAGNSVTFEPGARTAWHTHPLGQTLIITAGSGWV